MFVGSKKRNNHHAIRTAAAGKKTAVTLVDRKGDVKVVVVPNVRKSTVQHIARPIVDQSATIMTDVHVSYEGLSAHVAGHHTVDHSKTFVCGVIMHTNFGESCPSLWAIKPPVKPDKPKRKKAPPAPDKK